MRKPLILQVSIPFCVKRCSYCEYPYCTYDPGIIRAYGDALLTEIASCEGELDDYEVQAISVEGGSPALLGADALYEALLKIRRLFHCSNELQISLQLMPGDFSRVLMDRMRDAGVNFYTIGLQSADRKEHDLLERPYRYDAITMVDTAIRTFEPRELNFEVLCGIPGQSEKSLEQTLKRCLYYAPEHMTVYPLSVPKGSIMEQKILEKICPEQPALQVSELEKAAAAFLKQMGYIRYTRYDYVKDGREELKNRYRLLFLNDCECFGFGYHASSRFDGAVWTTGHSLQEYLDHSDDFSVTAVNPMRPDLLSLQNWKEHREFLLRVSES